MCKTLYAALLLVCLAQAGATRQTIKEHDTTSEDDTCSTTVTGSVRRNTHKKQTDKCKCPSGSFLMGENDKCQTVNRYFNPSDVEGLGCTCSTCSDIVANSKIRNTARKQESEKCKCPRKQIVSGDDEACSQADPTRYFDPIKLMGKDCQCLNEAEVKARTSSTTTTEVKTIFWREHTNLI